LSFLQAEYVKTKKSNQIKYTGAENL
jgi:hypothetical protein